MWSLPSTTEMRVLGLHVVSMFFSFIAFWNVCLVFGVMFKPAHHCTRDALRSTLLKLLQADNPTERQPTTFCNVDQLMQQVRHKHYPNSGSAVGSFLPLLSAKASVTTHRTPGSISCFSPPTSHDATRFVNTVPNSDNTRTIVVLKKKRAC